jgi:hypothetical protein
LRSAVFFEIYKVYGKFLYSYSLRAKEAFIAGLVVVQACVAGAFLAMSFTSVQIPLAAIAYIILETALALWMVFDILKSCAQINDRDKQLRTACMKISAALLLLPDPSASQLRQARAFGAIASYLEHESVISAKLFGVRITKELAVRVVGALVAATFSAALRSGLS